MYRPKIFEEFIGNEQVKERLRMYIDVCKQEDIVMPHVALYGSAGTGKTTLAGIIANESDGGFFSITGASLKTSEELFRMLSMIKETQKEKDVFLFIDEIHELPKATLPEAVWLPLFEDFKMFVNIFDAYQLPKMQRSKANKIKVAFTTAPFTIIGATTNPEGLSKPLRDRFTICCEMQDYATEEIAIIAQQCLDRLQFKIDPKALADLANRSRGNPRITNSICELCSFRALSKKERVITYDTFREEMTAQRVDNLGLGERDREMLVILIQNDKGMGIARIAAIMLVKTKALTEMHENYLAKIGLITMGQRGRIITAKGIKHLNTFYF
jgi:holliday junction DNA helicase RuvB